MKKIIVLVGVLTILTGCATSSHKVAVQTVQENGYGSVKLADGSVYSGEIEGITGEGFGTIESKDGTYTGAVRNGVPHGFGKTVTKDGAIYHGEHNKGEFHGRGQLILSDGSYFMGYMKHNKDDRGTMHFTDGRSVPVR